MAHIHTNPELCILCGRCAKVCPAYILTQEGKAEEIKIQHPQRCIHCGHCVDVCPVNAVEHSAFPASRIHPVRSELLPSPESLMELIRSRRSNRTLTDKPIDATVLEQIMEAARYAPTAENSRKVKLHLVTDSRKIYNIEKAVLDHFMRLASVLLFPPVKLLLKPFFKDLYSSAPELLAMHKMFKQGKRPVTCQATALLFFTAPKGYRFGYQDCNLAYQNASLMAESFGVSQIYMGFVQVAFQMIGVKKVAKLLGIERNQQTFAIMGLGIPAFRYPKFVERK